MFNEWINFRIIWTNSPDPDKTKESILRTLFIYLFEFNFELLNMKLSSIFIVSNDC